MDFDFIMQGNPARVFGERSSERRLAARRESYSHDAVFCEPHTSAKGVFPSERTEQPLAVDADLFASGQPMKAAVIARAFKRGGSRIEPRVQQPLTVLARYGHVTSLTDGRFAARRPA